MGLDPENAVLTDCYDEIVEKYVVADPQDVPPAILSREGALEPEELLRSPVWGALQRSRRPWVSRARARAQMIQALEHPDTYRARRRELRRTASRTVRQAVRQARAVRSR